MYTPFYIAKKLRGEQRQGSRVSRITSGIVTGSVALSIAVIIIALSIVGGFQREIRARAGGFSGQIVLLPLGGDPAGTPVPLSSRISYLPRIAEHREVAHIQSFANRQGLLQTDCAIQGILIKGIDKTYDRSFLESGLTEGAFPAWNDTLPSMELLISQRLSNSLKLKVGQAVTVYFIEQPVRARRFTVSGIYGASLENVDQSLVIGDIRVIQQLNGWTPAQVSGVELQLHRPERMEQVAREIEQMAVRQAQEDDPDLWIHTAKDLFPHLFDWLNLIDTNLLIVLVLMISVAGINMITSLLIMLFDKTAMIGLLKALGMRGCDIRLTFIYRMSMLVVKGMIIGNAVALALCCVQQRFQLILLDQANYAVSSVPVSIRLWNIMLMNIVSLLLIAGFMLLATMTIDRITPERSLRAR